MAAAWLAALLTLGSDLLEIQHLGLSTLLLLVIFLGLVWCLTHIEQLGARKIPTADTCCGWRCWPACWSASAC